MAEWRRICCAIDFSDPSRVAMQEAAVLARRLESWLTLVHVFDAPDLSEANTLRPTPELLERLSREAEEALERWRAEAEGMAARPVRSAMPVGDATTELLRFASEGGYDLMVMATHGRTGFRRLVLGSVAERVVRPRRTARCWSSDGHAYRLKKLSAAAPERSGSPLQSLLRWYRRGPAWQVLPSAAAGRWSSAPCPG